MLSLLAAAPALAGPVAPAAPCHTLALMPGIVLAPELLGDVEPPPPPDEKASRDAYGVPYQLESDNFVLRWGGGVTEASAQTVLDAFEHSWDVEVDQMAHPPPQGSDRYRFNVYVGNSGGGTPQIPDGTAGYFYTDAVGWPMIVLHPDVVRRSDEFLTTIPHELYHAVQYASETFEYDGEGAWFWEATASWVEIEVYPDRLDYALPIGGYALLPHLQLDFFDYPDTWVLEEYHQYGAFIFPRYVSEFVGDWRIIRNAWVEPRVVGNRPLAAVGAELEALGVPLEQAFMDFAARNVTWDYAHGETYAYYTDFWVDYYPEQDHRVHASFEGAGSGGTWSPEDALSPRRFGVNTVSLASPDDGDLTVRFDGDAEGSRGSDAAFGLTAVRVSGDTVEYTPLLLGGTTGELVVPDVGGLDAVHIVVGAWSDTLRWSEFFDYRIELEVGPPQPDTGGADTGTERGGTDTGPDGGEADTVITRQLPAWTPGPRSSCGCSTRRSTGAGGALAAFFVGLAALAGRRRER